MSGPKVVKTSLIVLWNIHETLDGWENQRMPFVESDLKIKLVEFAQREAAAIKTLSLIPKIFA